MRAKARRHKPGVMNKGEAAYAQHLEERKHAGEIVEYLFESEKLRLADLAYYSPDFFVMLVFPFKAGGWGRVDFGPHATNAPTTAPSEEVTCGA